MATAREQWMLGRHDPEAMTFLRTFQENLVVAVHGLGDVRVCHGSRAATPSA
ncbi:MAG: hypothetical protein ABI927_04495 [Gaiellaceae bacterium]